MAENFRVVAILGGRANETNSHHDKWNTTHPQAFTQDHAHHSDRTFTPHWWASQGSSRCLSICNKKFTKPNTSNGPSFTSCQITREQKFIAGGSPLGSSPLLKKSRAGGKHTPLSTTQQGYFLLNLRRSHVALSVSSATAVTLRKSSFLVVCGLAIRQFGPVGDPVGVISGRIFSMCRGLGIIDGIISRLFRCLFF